MSTLVVAACSNFVNLFISALVFDQKLEKKSRGFVSLREGGGGGVGAL